MEHKSQELASLMDCGKVLQELISSAEITVHRSYRGLEIFHWQQRKRCTGDHVHQAQRARDANKTSTPSHAAGHDATLFMICLLVPMLLTWRAELPKAIHRAQVIAGAVQGRVLLQPQQL